MRLRSSSFEVCARFTKTGIRELAQSDDYCQWGYLRSRTSAPSQFAHEEVSPSHRAWLEDPGSQVPSLPDRAHGSPLPPY